MSMSDSAIKNSNFLKFLIGVIFSTLGFWIQKLALGWLAWELTESPFWVGIVSLCIFLPIIFTSPLFGVLVDRFDLKRNMIVTLVMMFGGTSALTLLTALDLINIHLLVVIAIYSGFTLSAFHPIRLAILPAIIKKEQLPQAIATISIIFNLSQMMGPMLSGLLIAHTEIYFAFLFSALGLIPHIVIIAFFLTISPRSTVPAQDFKFFSALVDGLLFSLKSSIIRNTLLLTALVALFGKGIIEMLPAVSETFFQRGSSGLGELMSTVGIGAIVASGFLSRKQLYPRMLPRYLSFGVMLLCLALILLGVSTIYWLSLLSLFGLGVAISFSQISSQSIVQLQVADNYRARVISLWGILSMGLAGFGALIIGFISELVGLSSAITLVSVATFVLALNCVRRIVSLDMSLAKQIL